MDYSVLCGLYVRVFYKVDQQNSLSVDLYYSTRKQSLDRKDAARHTRHL